jgi:high-affinity Fe2+/Pb2+ permease
MRESFLNVRLEMHLLLSACFCFAQQRCSSLNEGKLISQSLEKRGKNAN